jgi:hypothetical protein
VGFRQKHIFVDSFGWWMCFPWDDLVISFNEKCSKEGKKIKKMKIPRKFWKAR